MAAIANIELANGMWPDLIPGLLSNVNASTAKAASLQAIGFICEQVEPEILEKEASLILTAVVQGARKEEADEGVRGVALRALYNSLEFVRKHFDNEGEIDLMQGSVTM